VWNCRELRTHLTEFTVGVRIVTDFLIERSGVREIIDCETLREEFTIPSESKCAYNIWWFQEVLTVKRYARNLQFQLSPSARIISSCSFTHCSSIDCTILCTTVLLQCHVNCSSYTLVGWYTIAV